MEKKKKKMKCEESSERGLLSYYLNLTQGIVFLVSCEFDIIYI